MIAAPRIGRVSRAPDVAVKPVADCATEQQQVAVVQQLEHEEPICRLCWGEAEEASPGGQLICPCSCSGSLKFIHRRCLADWQRTLRNQGQARRAGICELCKCPYRVSEQQQQALAGSQQRLHRRLLTSLNNAVFDALYATSWPALAMRLWRSYVMVHGIAQALRLGVSGFSAGLSIGKALIEEQASLLNNVLGYTSSLLGSPYAEMIWCQAVGALFVGMLSELVYTSILGMLGGLAYGFCTGYVTAVKSSVQLLSGTSCKVVTAATCLVVKAVRRLLGLVLRVC